MIKLINNGGVLNNDGDKWDASEYMWADLAYEEEAEEQFMGVDPQSWNGVTHRQARIGFDTATVLGCIGR